MLALDVELRVRVRALHAAPVGATPETAAWRPKLFGEGARAIVGRVQLQAASESAGVWQAALSVCRGDVLLEGGGGEREHAVSEGMQHGHGLATLSRSLGSGPRRWTSPAWRRPSSPLVSTQMLCRMYIARVLRRRRRQMWLPRCRGCVEIATTAALQGRRAICAPLTKNAV